VEFSVSGVSVAKRQTGFCHPVPGVLSLPAIRGGKRPLKRMDAGWRTVVFRPANGIAHSIFQRATTTMTVCFFFRRANFPSSRGYTVFNVGFDGQAPSRGCSFTIRLSSSCVRFSQFRHTFATSSDRQAPDSYASAPEFAGLVVQQEKNRNIDCLLPGKHTSAERCRWKTIDEKLERKTVRQIRGPQQLKSFIRIRDDRIDREVNYRRQLYWLLDWCYSRPRI
jgi:hypothetical protein